MPTVSLNKMIEKLELKNLTPEVSTEGIEISSPDSVYRLSDMSNIHI